MIANNCLYICFPIRGGNRAGRAGLGLANSGPGQNRAVPKLARFFQVKILTAQPVLKTGSIEPNSLFKAKKKSRAGRAGLGHTGLGHTGPGQIWPDFFRANNLMAQPGPNFGRTGLAHQVGPILSPLFLAAETILEKGKKGMLHYLQPESNNKRKYNKRIGRGRKGEIRTKMKNKFKFNKLILYIYSILFYLFLI